MRIRWIANSHLKCIVKNYVSYLMITLLLSDDVNSLGELTNICAQVATIEGEDTCILLLILLDDRAVDTCSKVLEIIRR